MDNQKKKSFERTSRAPIIKRLFYYMFNLELRWIIMPQDIYVIGQSDDTTLSGNLPQLDNGYRSSK